MRHLLLPAQNTHTLHDPIRDTEHARAGGVEDGLGVGGLDGGGDVGNVVRHGWCVRKLRPAGGSGHISYPFWVHFLSDTYPDVSCLYPEGYTYPNVS